MKKRTIILAALAAALISTAGIGSAYAYFTTYAEAQGGYSISLGDRTEITERFADWTKTLVVTSEEDSEPVYIRARAYAGVTYPLEYEGSGWTAGDDGWYYYDQIVNGGESTSELNVKISGIPEEEALKMKDNNSFNVVVVYESAPVRYDEAGNPSPDWSATLDSVTETEGGVN